MIILLFYQCLFCPILADFYEVFIFFLMVLCVLVSRFLNWSLKNDTWKSPTSIWKIFWKPQIRTKNRRSPS